MPYRGRDRMRNGVNLFQRTREVERLALAGVYHFDIARRLGVSLSLIEQTMRLLRRAGRVPLMKGPRAAVMRADWTAARAIWGDPTVSMRDAVRTIGCSERTIYRRLGRRTDGFAKGIRTADTPAPIQVIAPAPPKPGWSMTSMRGPDPHRGAREVQTAQASRGSL